MAYPLSVENNTPTGVSDNEVDISDDEKVSRSSCCWNSMFCVDVIGTFRCQPTFRSSETRKEKDGSSNTKMIDIPASFSPRGSNLLSSKDQHNTKVIERMTTVSIVMWKSFVIAIELTAITYGFFFDPKFFYFAYLTIWALVVSFIYSILSLFNTLIPVKVTVSPRKEKEEEEEENEGNNDEGTNEDVVSIRVATTWAFFNLAAVTQIVVTVMYWAVVYTGGPVHFKSVLEHGVISILIWIDGLLVNRIPVRCRHWTEINLPFYLLYMIWTVLQSPLVFSIPNPNNPDDDGIYAVLDWYSSPAMTAIIILLVIFILSPIIQLVLWGASLLLKRRYVTTEVKNNIDNV